MHFSRVFTAFLLLVPGLVLAQGGPPGGRAVTVESLLVEPSVLRSTVKAVGTVLADASALLRAEVPGQIVGLHFNDGEPVIKGQRLFSIEATVFEAETNEAKANAEQSEAAYTRAKELINDRLISATDFDTARANRNVSVARLLSSESRLAKTTIRAPFDGFVGLRQINIGDYATIGQELVSVVRLDPLRVEFSVPETRLAQLKNGQEINVSIDAYPGEGFEGVITAIAPLIDAAGHSVTIRARLPNPDLKLRPGLFAQVSITLAVKADALMVPEQAIWPIGQTKTVYVVENGKAVHKTVTTGERKPGWVEITSGLNAGEDLVTAGQMKIFNGAAVKTIPATGVDK